MYAWHDEFAHMLCPDKILTSVIPMRYNDVDNPIKSYNKWLTTFRYLHFHRFFEFHNITLFYFDVLPLILIEIYAYNFCDYVSVKLDNISDRFINISQNILASIVFCRYYVKR